MIFSFRNAFTFKVFSKYCKAGSVYLRSKATFRRLNGATKVAFPASGVVVSVPVTGKCSYEEHECFPVSWCLNINCFVVYFKYI